MKALVTGAAGYIGTALVKKLLDEGIEVVAVDNFTFLNEHTLLSRWNSRLSIHYEDVRDIEQWWDELGRDCHVIYPLAALVGAPLCETRPEESWEINAESVRKLVELASPQQRIIYPNTNSGYGTTDGKSLCTEQDPLNPISTYGKSKCRGEQHVLQHPNSVVLRLATVFGVSDRMRFDLLVNDWTEQLYRNRKLDIYEPEFKRNFVHIQDVVRAMWVFGFWDKQNTGVFNFGNSEANMTKMELAKLIASQVPDVDLNICDGNDPDKRNYIVSNEKVLRTGFSFFHSVKDGIQDVLKYCQTVPSHLTHTMRNVP